jgi:mortality factor 4-like protein 1
MSSRGHVAYAVDERVLCWHLDLVYEAKVLEVKRDAETPEYYVHYKGWKNTYVKHLSSVMDSVEAST